MGLVPLAQRVCGAGLGCRRWCQHQGRGSCRPRRLPLGRARQLPSPPRLLRHLRVPTKQWKCGLGQSVWLSRLGSRVCSSQPQEGHQLMPQRSLGDCRQCLCGDLRLLLRARPRRETGASGECVEAAVEAWAGRFALEVLERAVLARVRGGRLCVPEVSPIAGCGTLCHADTASEHRLPALSHNTALKSCANAVDSVSSESQPSRHRVSQRASHRS